MADDVELLRRYIENRSEEAFAELVQRHLNLVYSVALRQVGGDVHLAEDVVQVVFTAVARKASALAERPMLGGWLYRTTQFAAIDVVRAEQRRRRREETAGVMADVVNSDGETPDWEKLRPTLDEVIGELGDEDRDAVVLRFFHGQPFAEIGTRLRMTENGARMRVERALEKLHALLARRGVTSTTAALGVALGNQIGVAAPAGLAASVSGVALAGVVNSGGAMAAAGALFTMSKIKIGIAAAIVLGGASVALVELRANRELKAELQGADTTTADMAAAKKENLQATATLKQIGGANPEVSELLKLRQRAAILRARPEGVVDSAMKLATTWQNRGRETPEATWETFCDAIRRDDLEAVARLFVFRDDTLEARDAFMAKLSDAVRARYPTPERVCAAALFNLGAGVSSSPNDAFQILEVRELGPGIVKLHVWIRRNEEEFAGGESYSKTEDGWAVALPQLFRLSEVALNRLDPLTGNVLLDRK